VVFSPVVDGKTVRAVEFTRVLHEPDLRNNLLSVLYLTRNIGFTVHINSSHMSFERPTGTPLFVATISGSNAAFLDRSTVPLAEYASAATTVPLDIDLWHRRLAHHHLAGVRTLLDKALVTVLGHCQPLLSLLASPTLSHHTLMTLILMVSRVLMSLWIMGGRLVLQHFLQSFL
jgi:hypothetical protein